MPVENNRDRLNERPITRRDLIKGGMAAASVGAAALGAGSCSRDRIYRADYPDVPENKVKLQPNGKSVLILGGGFSGMHAACELADRGFKVTIIEKSGLLGGKLKSWRDENFGVPPTGDPDWRGYPRDHGVHAVWGSYNNLREFMGRHGYELWKFPPQSTIYNYVVRDGSGFQLGRQPTWPWPLGRIQALFQTNNELKKIVGPDAGMMRQALLKMASFDFDDYEQRMYLDSISFPEWARTAGMPEAAIYNLFGSNSEMAIFDHIDHVSALSTLSLSSLVSGHPDDLRVGVFLHPPGETYIAPIEKYIKDRGGEIIFNTPVIKVNRDGAAIKSITAGEEGASTDAGTRSWRCRVCGSVFNWPARPARCQVCGAASSQLTPNSTGPPKEYFADYYILAMDVPGARQVISRSGLSGEVYFDNILKLDATGVYPVNIWYSECSSWEKRFPGHANFFPSGFKFLGITINLASSGKIRGRRVAEPLVSEYQDKNINVIETQIANTRRVEGLDDEMIARLVHEELKIIMPDLPDPTDHYVNRWDNYSPQRVGDEALRPPIQSPMENFFIIGDWVKTGHLSVYMEKANVAAKMAVNLIMDRAGQKKGRITILPSGTPSAIIKTCRRLFSVYP
jgi:isorenieratene synthase